MPPMRLVGVGDGDGVGEGVGDGVGDGDRVTTPYLINAEFSVLTAKVHGLSVAIGVKLS